MIRVNANEVSPYKHRHLDKFPRELVMKVLLSPMIQQGLTGLGLGMTIYPPHTANVQHTHLESQETWYVVSGEGEMVVGEGRLKLESDTAIVVPPRVPHYIVNTGDEELKVIWIFTPPGPETEFIS